jgi:hypothetical protein
MADSPIVRELRELFQQTANCQAAPRANIALARSRGPHPTALASARHLGCCGPGAAGAVGVVAIAAPRIPIGSGGMTTGPAIASPAVAPRQFNPLIPYPTFLPPAGLGAGRLLGRPLQPHARWAAPRPALAAHRAGLACTANSDTGRARVIADRHAKERHAQDRRQRPRRSGHPAAGVVPGAADGRARQLAVRSVCYSRDARFLRATEYQVAPSDADSREDLRPPSAVAGHEPGELDQAAHRALS